MSDEKITTNHLEEKLFQREFQYISAKLEKIGQEINDVLKPYFNEVGGINVIAENEAGKVCNEFIKRMLFINTKYHYGSDVASGGYYLHESWIPTSIKKAILQKAVSDFMAAVKRVEEIADNQ